MPYDYHGEVTEAVAHLAELRFIKHLKHLTDGLLYSTVNYRRDAKPTFLPVCLGISTLRTGLGLYVPSRREAINSEPCFFR